MRKFVSSVLLSLLFSVPGCGGSASSKPKPTPTPTPPLQFCVGNFTEMASVQIGNAASQPQVLQIQGPCTAVPALKPGTAMSVPVGTSSASAQITLQPYENDFTTSILTPDTITLRNCSGSATVSKTGSVTKTIQPGVVVGDTFYGSAPTPGDTLDLLAEAVYVQEATTIAAVTAGTNLYTLTAPPHTMVTRFITWTEHLIAGQVSVAPQHGTPQLTSIYAIPIGVQFDGFKDSSAHC